MMQVRSAPTSDSLPRVKDGVKGIWCLVATPGLQASDLGVLTTKSIAGVVLRGNHIFSPGRALQPAEMVSATNCTGIVVEDNIVVTTTRQ